MNAKYKIQLILLLAMCVCMACACAGCINHKDDQAEPAPPATLIGNFLIHYDLQITESGGVGTSNDHPMKAQAIHFYNDYIVIEPKRGSGKLIPIRQIKDFRWNSE